MTRAESDGAMYARLSRKKHPVEHACAFAEFSASLAHKPKPNWENKSEVQKALEEYSEALEEYSKALEEYPEAVDLAEVYEEDDTEVVDGMEVDE